MFTYAMVQVLAYSIIIPVLIGIIRHKKILKQDWPFLIFLLLGLANEVLSSIIPGFTGNNAVNSNVYVFVEGLLLLFIFYYWKFQTRRPELLFFTLAAILSLVWIGDNLVFNPITRFNSVYRVLYSLVIVFFSISKVNQALFEETDSIFRNHRFLICLGFILFFSYRMVFEVFYMYDFGFSADFYNRLFDIFVIINVITNFIYALALLWMPTKQRFTLPY